MSKLLAGRYELIDKIGEGGMAVVYKAKDRLLNRYVAIKVLRPEYTRDESFVDSFKRESQAAAGLQHPNIVAVYDVGKAGNINYIVMELVEGKTLSEIIDEKAPLDYKVVIDIGKQMASALALAHKHEIIHRDVKPHNILVTPDGIAKLTDFGIAKAVSNSTMVADTSRIIGSVHYFSPEQARGAYVDERSDIYSLGIVLYEMLTGRVPFDGDTPVEVALKHINEEIIPPTKLNKSIPPNLEKLVLKATDKFQSNRYKTAEEMLEDLKNIEFVSSMVGDRVFTGTASTLVADEKEKEKEEEKPQKKSKLPVAMPKKQKKETTEADADEDKKEKKRRWIFLGVIGVLALVGLLLFLYMSGIIGDNSKNEVQLPDLTNKTYDEARQALKDLGLEIKDGEPISSSDVEEGKVAMQMPVSGTRVKKGRTVTVRLSSGPGEIEIPDFSNYSFEQAKETAEGLGLRVEKGEELSSDTVPKGLVVKQSPSPKSMAKKGETITLNISSGPEETTSLVPKVVGEPFTSREDIDSILSPYGFTVGDVTYVESGTAEPGTIITQSPESGTTAEKGGYINIEVATLPKMPSLTGKTLEEARDEMAAKNIRVELASYVESPTGTPGTIIDQSVAYGEEVEPETVVYVYVIKEPEPTPEDPGEDEGGEEGESGEGEESGGSGD